MKAFNSTFNGLKTMLCPTVSLWNIAWYLRSPWAYNFDHTLQSSQYLYTIHHGCPVSFNVKPALHLFAQNLHQIRKCNGSEKGNHFEDILGTCYLPFKHKGMICLFKKWFFEPRKVPLWGLYLCVLFAMIIPYFQYCYLLKIAIMKGSEFEDVWNLSTIMNFLSSVELAIHAFYN